MEIFRTIRDADVGSVEAAPADFRERRAARAVVFDGERKVALLHSMKNRYHKLPGGGVEEGEDLEAALRRELLEEIGCAVSGIREVGAIEEYRNKFKLHQFSYCYVVDVSGERRAASGGGGDCRRFRDGVAGFGLGDPGFGG